MAATSAPRTDVPIIRPSNSDPNAVPSITLYTGQSANGIKISILLHELGIPYYMYKVNMSEKEQKAPWYLERVNPNGRIPAITDTLADGTAIRLFESGAILQYLTERYDTAHKLSYPALTPKALEVNAWLHWQIGGLGPMQGQAHYFVRYCPTGPNPAAVTRYVEETKRLYKTLDGRLAGTGSQYIVGDKCTIADIACWGWISVGRWATVELDEYPALQAWEERMFRRPGVEEGRHVPDPHHRELLQSPEKMEEFERRGREFFKAYEQGGVSKEDK